MCIDMQRYWWLVDDTRVSSHPMMYREGETINSRFGHARDMGWSPQGSLTRRFKILSDISGRQTTGIHTVMIRLNLHS